MAPEDTTAAEIAQPTKKVVTTSDTGDTASKAPKAPKAPKESKEPIDRSTVDTAYPQLSASFMKGSFKGQVDSAYKAFAAGNPTRANSFKKALGDGKLSYDACTDGMMKKLAAMGIEVPAQFHPAPKVVGEPKS